MTLVIATEGCCKGHPCDNCKTCQSGRCCRRDNPNYKLPGLGEWDGPIYGELGVLACDGEKQQCHACGEWFTGLIHHAWGAHDLLAREYKATFGLNMKTALVGPGVSARLSAYHKAQTDPFGGKRHDNTPEFMSSIAPRRYSRERTMQAHNFHARKTATGYMGVKQRDQKWGAEIYKDRQYYYLGRYDTPEDAARARDAKARELYGDKARLNFPDET